MNIDNLHKLGSVLKTTGIQGELIISFESGLPKDFEKMESVIIDVDGLLVPFFIENIVRKSSSTAIVKFEDINDENSSVEFVSSIIYGKVDLSPNKEVTLNYLEKFKVINLKDGSLIGEVIEFVDIQNNPLLKVKIDKKKEVLLPAHKDFIVEIKNKKKEIIYSLPDGLLDL